MEIFIYVTRALLCDRGYMMRYFSAFLFSLSFSLVQGDTPFSRGRVTGFYDEFLSEEKDIVATVDLTTPPSPVGSSTSTPPSPPPPPPTNPVAPAPVKGYFPIVISNQTTQSNSQVYVLITNNGETQILKLRGKFPGEMSSDSVSSTTFTPDYSYALTSFPTSTTGSNDFLIYVPNTMNSGRINFSIGTYLYFQNNTPTLTLTAPISYTFSDPNFNVLYDFAELTITKLPAHPSHPEWVSYQPFLDTTQVDNWGLPIQLGLYTLNTNQPTVVTPYIPAGAPGTNPAGFSGNRDTLMTTIVAGLTSPWSNLAIPFYTTPYAPGAVSTYLRILAPKTGTAVTLPQPQLNYAIPQFPLTYITSPTNYLGTLFTFYVTNSLYIQADGTTGSGQTYQGTVAAGVVGSRTFTFTSSSYSTTLLESSITTTQLYGTTLSFTTGSAPTNDITILQKYFGSAFSVGLLGVAGVFASSGTSLNGTTLVSHLPGSGGVTPLYYTPAGGYNGYNLYAQYLHANAILPTSPPYTAPLPTEGLCYAFDYDDTLGMSSTVSEPATTLSSSNVYAILTLGPIPTVPTGVFTDSTSYTLTFTIPARQTLQYRQGSSGPFLTATSGTPIAGVVSTSSNPFQIKYDNLNFTVFPKYQFLQPIDQYITNHNAVIQAAIFTPNIAAAPTAFTITNLPSLL